MRFLFLLVLSGHALLHLPGFLRAFGLASFESLSLPVERSWGLVWLLAAIVLLAGAGLFALKISRWYLVVAGGIVLSQLLILRFWSDAGWGTLVNVLLTLPLVLLAAREEFYAGVTEAREELLTASAGAEWQGLQSVRDLPTPVLNWLMRTGALGRPELRTAWMKQDLQLRLEPGQRRWYPATATQLFTLASPAFQWSVDVRMNWLIHVFGSDALHDGNARMRMSLWNLWPVGRVDGNEKVTEAAIQRYLAELAWFPLVALSPTIQWEHVDDTTARATMTLGEVSGSGTFCFTTEGDFSRFEALRYRDGAPAARRIPWIARVDDWAEFEGIRVPSRLRATWQLDSGDWTWIKIRVADLHYATAAEANHPTPQPAVLLDQ